MMLILIVFLITQIDNIGRKLYPFPYRETITYHATAHIIDPILLAAIIKTESNFNPKALSTAGARGLVQIMPDTGDWIANQMSLLDFDADKLYHPETNIKMGAWYLADLTKAFHNNQTMVLAAYNAGRGNVSKWIDNHQWTGYEKDIDQIPFPETRHYVRKVTWNYKVYHYLYNKS